MCLTRCPKTLLWINGLSGISTMPGIAVAGLLAGKSWKRLRRED